MTKYTMKIVGNDEGADQARIIIEVNGFELDILADDQGICATLQKGDIVQTELAFDWDEKHENAAPDLLEALEELHFVTDPKTFGGSIEDARVLAANAIAKAKGGAA